MPRGNIIIAGIGGAIGTAVANSLHDKGWKISGWDKNLSNINDLNSDIDLLEVDIANEISVASGLNDLDGPICGLVNCSGLIFSEPLITLTRGGVKRISLESFNTVIESNLHTSFVIGSQIAERMVLSRTQGVIINFSSLCAAGNVGQSAYSAAKASLESLTRVWAKELGPLGIRALAIAPGFIDTQSTRSAVSKHTLNQITSNTPLRRLGTISEVVHCVHFAIENQFLTGTVLHIDGGLVI